MSDSNNSSASPEAPQLTAKRIKITNADPASSFWYRDLRDKEYKVISESETDFEVLRTENKRNNQKGYFVKKADCEILE